MHIRGEDRFQSVMFPEVLEDYVSEDAQVRYIDAFVDRLDFEAMNFQKGNRQKHRPTALSPW